MPTPTTPLLDSFNRADEDPLAGSWLGPIFTSSSQMKLSAAAGIGRSGVDCNSYWKNAFPRDQEIVVTLKTKWTTNDLNVALFLNLTLPNTANLCCYIFAFFTSSATGNETLQVYRVDAGSFTQLGADATIGAGGTIAAGSKFWCQNVGGLLSVYHMPPGGQWTLVTTRTDTTYGVGFLGIACDNETPVLDDCLGGAVGHNAYAVVGQRPYPFSPGNPNFPARF